jgi:hypothetical protein
LMLAFFVFRLFLLLVFWSISLDFVTLLFPYQL